mgnify:FL=1|jgi:rRNA-processing protein FCF1|tara:strand:- start:2605 stop:2970 length:366 start_codon:yes stop_codon:yes gene_type:complete
MKVLLDTSFIVSCIRKRIDFLTGLKEQGFEIFLPREVLQELKDLKKKSSTSQEDRLAINVAFEMFEKEDFKKISLGGKNVDLGLIEKGKNGFFIATLDAEIKNSIPNKIVIFSSKKSVGRE